MNAHTMIESGQSSRPVRCAVYTRKSTTDGLEQSHNSLDAQRDTCDAFVRSRAPFGWNLSPEKYDDGGFTGGNMERPALARLLEDVRAKKVDVVVVYKVDRLSRSLLDFANMLAMFEKSGVGLVSVTQQFDTTSSMGRLTLHILLSFAQFEREIISERTRDKIYSSRRKGKWTGGVIPLGYDLDQATRRLVPNATESELVREVFTLYREYRSTLKVARLLNARGATTKGMVTTRGRTRGGHAWDKQAVSRLLRMRLYTGEIGHKGSWFEGEHEGIIERGVFDAVQTLLAASNTAQLRSGAKEPDPSWLLRGLMSCAQCGCAMTPTSTQGKKHRAYRCNGRDRGSKSVCTSKPVNAAQIEDLVVERLRVAIVDEHLVEATMRKLEVMLAERLPALNAELVSLYEKKESLTARGAELIAMLRTGKKTGGTMLGHALGQIDAELVDTEREIVERETKRARLERQSASSAHMRETAHAFKPVWKELTPAERQRVVQMWIEKVTVDVAAGRMDIRFRTVPLLGAENDNGREVAA